MQPVEPGYSALFRSAATRLGRPAATGRQPARSQGRPPTIHNPLTPPGEQPPSRRRQRRTLLLVLAGAAALAAVLVVVLSSGGGGGRRPTAARLLGSAATGPTVVQLAARYLHVSPADVRQRLAGGETLAQIAAEHGSSRSALLASIYAQKAAQIKAEHLAPERERAELEALRSTLAERVSHRRVSSLTAAAAGYLGLGVGQLGARLRSGHSLAALATAEGRSRAGLLEAMTKGRRKEIEAIATKGGISAAVAKRRIARLLRRTERLIEQPGG